MQSTLAFDLGRNWGWLLFRGILGIVFGLVALTHAEATVEALLIIFGAYLIIDGLAIVLAATSLSQPYIGSGLLITEGVVTIAAGVFSVVRPGVVALAVVLFWAAWALVTGAFEVAAGVRIHRDSRNAFLIAAGIVSVVFGLVVFATPSAGVVVLSWCVGLYALFFGVSLSAAALRLRWHVSSIPHPRIEPLQPDVEEELVRRPPASRSR